MQFLRSLFWVIIAVAMLIFAVQNNKLVTVNLWGGLQADVKLWLLVLGPLLLGFLPTWIFGRVSLWRQQRQASRVAPSMSGASDALPVFDPRADDALRDVPTAPPATAPPAARAPRAVKRPAASSS